MYYVYVLKSLKDGKLYTGYTKNLKNRFKRHSKGLVNATKYRLPIILIYYEASIYRKDAMKREIYLKSNWGKRYLKSRLNEFYLKKG
jgi:putative endonuclease